MNIPELKLNSPGIRMLNSATDSAAITENTTVRFDAKYSSGFPASTNILIIAGEPSGDMHSAKLVRELKLAQPNLMISAMGGEELAAAGANIIVDAKDLAVVGFVEVIKVVRQLKNAFTRLKKLILEQHPKIVILVDYPGFNFRMAKFAKQHGCHVIYYISPQVWAWHQSRVHKIKRWVDVMAVIFPFEVEFFQRFNICAKFVGHPLAAAPLCPFTPAEAKQELQLHPKHQVIGLVPGSRLSEVRAILPPLLAAAAELYQQNSQLQFVLPKASNIDADWLNQQLAKYPVPITVTTHNRYTTMQACDIAIAASGTVTLELALLEKPMIIAYKGNALSFWLAKRLVKLKHIGLPNIVAKHEIVPELLQSALSPANIVAQVNLLLSDPSYYSTQKQHLAAIHQQLKSPITEICLTALILEILGPLAARTQRSSQEGSPQFTIENTII
jgi:lipid-A-disaccharide synthase